MPFESHCQSDLLLSMSTATTQSHTDICVYRNIHRFIYTHTHIHIYTLYAHILLSCFSTVNSFFSLIFILHSSKGSHYEQSLKRRKPCSTSLKAEYLHKIFGILLNRRSVSSHLFNYLCIILQMPVQTHGYLLGTLRYNSVLCCCSTCFSSGYWDVFQS